MGEGLNTLTLAESGGRTTMTAIALYADKETRDAVIASGMEGGASETFDRLAELLATLV
jgi:uncharacterized protein YndB with AHSA1/START domain